MNILLKSELHLVKRPSCREFVEKEWSEGRDVDRNIIYVSEKNATAEDYPRAKELSDKLGWDKYER